MASLASLYLCSRTVYAAVGSPTAKGARITAAAAAQLPEGCLINGVITNEADLAEALKAFFARHKLPTGRVALIVGGSQFVHRVISLPAMSEKKRLAVLAHELSSGGAETTAPLDDYMLLARDAKTRADTVLATRVEQSVIAGYAALAKAAGFKLYSIDLGLAAPIKAVRTIPALQSETFVLLHFDDDTVSACLFVKGQYTYSTRSRLFNPRGSAESGAEIAQKLSGILQFHIARAKIRSRPSTLPVQTPMTLPSAAQAARRSRCGWRNSRIRLPSSCLRAQPLRRRSPPQAI